MTKRSLLYKKPRLRYKHDYALALEISIVFIYRKEDKKRDKRRHSSWRGSERAFSSTGEHLA